MNDLVIMPKSLTYENGAKSAFSGEFFVEIKVPNVNEHADYDEPEYYTQRVPIPWSTIKEMYNEFVKKFGKRVD